MSLKTQSAKRRSSFVELEDNPIEAGSGDDGILHLESLADTVKIEKQDLDNIISILENLKDNTARIRTLHSKKTPYLFSSADLLKILQITASVKTRIAFIAEIGPRLTDPKAKSAEIVDMFRYSEEKRQVEEILKARSLTVATQSGFSRPPPLSGGRGGRGRGGRGGAGGRVAAGGRTGSHQGATSVPTPAPKTSSISAQIAAEDGIESKAVPTPSATESKSQTTESSPDDRSVSVSEPKTPVKASMSADGTISCTPPASAQSVTTPNSTGSAISGLTSASATPSPGRRISTHRLSGGGLNSRLSGGSSRRKSSIVVSTSVLSSLGLAEVDDISLDGVPLELWEQKARHSSNAVEVSLAEEDRLREIARSKLREDEESRIRALREEREEEEAEARLRQAEEEENAGTRQRSMPFSFVEPVEPGGGSTEPEISERDQFNVSEGAVKGLIAETVVSPSADKSNIEKANPIISIDSSTPPTAEKPVSDVDAPASTPVAAEEPVSDVDAPTSTPVAAEEPISDVDAPTSTPVAAEEPISDVDAPTSTPVAAEEPISDVDAPTSTPVAAVEQGGVMNWMRRRFSVTSSAPLAVEPSETETTSDPVAPLDAANVENASKCDESKEKVVGSEGEGVSDMGSAPVSDAGTVNDEPAPTGWRSVVKRVSASLDMSMSGRAAAEQERNRSGTGTIDYPHQTSENSRPARGSLQKLREEKKVGTIMGFFESLVKGSASSGKSDDAPAALDGVSKQVTSAGVPLPIADERMAQYLEMKPENSIGFDEATGRALYSYHELVRRNYVKHYENVSQHELEEHMADGEFLLRLNMTKEEFRALPKWRRTERKKNLMLF